MKKKLKRLSYTLLVISILFPTLVLGGQVAFAQTNLNIEASASILVDAKSGKILYGDNYETPLPPASMTKMMTEYLVLEALHNGTIKLDDTVIASEYANWMGKYGGSRVFLALGEAYTVEELIYAMAVYSANDATVALAEHIGGTESNFADMMNKKAKEFGMNHTNFLTSSGYPADELGKFTPTVTGEHYMSARDAATLAWHLINDYPDILTYTSTPMLNFRDLKNLPNWNWMLPGVVSSYQYPGLDGLKTGHTDKAGYNFTGTAYRNDHRLISVVMGTTSIEKRFVETKKLLDYGFSFYQNYTLVDDNQAIPGFEQVVVEKGKETEVSAVSKNKVNIVIKKGEEELYKPTVVLNENIQAPIEAGEKLGVITYEYTGSEKYDFLTPAIKEANSVELVAQEDVEEAGMFRLFFRKLINMFKSIFDAILG